MAAAGPSWRRLVSGELSILGPLREIEVHTPAERRAKVAVRCAAAGGRIAGAGAEGCSYRTSSVRKTMSSAPGGR